MAIKILPHKKRSVGLLLATYLGSEVVSTDIIIDLCSIVIVLLLW